MAYRFQDASLELRGSVVYPLYAAKMGDRPSSYSEFMMSQFAVLGLRSYRDLGLKFKQ
ncbi:hypothetical protein VB780_21765 [Leptolyngbya sp. CCNP1308]|uniref:hypothetical protein n=1 Tax=Leptolyngbya sp. CCNP1308 TaxID=3110255 RepID=UPI002B1F2793|nr:hypothetical protein [Leptolyngbya sp. CCNP1308]MEA5451223.1 hypothetical protein [Leptolyngbya sp. CCNP1308]